MLTCLDLGGLCCGIFVDEAIELMVQNRLKHKWNKLTQNGIIDIMKNEWEYIIKSQFRLNNRTTNEYHVVVSIEAFEDSNMNDFNRKPIMKNRRIIFV